MAIVVNLDVMLAKRKMRSRELAERVGITEQNISLLKSGKVRGVRFDTLEAICEALQCQPGDLLEYRASHPSSEPSGGHPDDSETPDAAACSRLRAAPPFGGRPGRAAPPAAGSA